ncbi:MAG: response regulator [Planctomycetia bacterium]|nr:response regulator [Planctomycetia bacterium]
MKKKILVVDDEEQIIKLLTMRLQINNYEVVSAYDGYQCVQMVKEEKPDLILLDIKMPLGGGIKAFETLRNNNYTENIPVIFITAYPSVEVKKHVIEMGAAGFIAKPFDSEELLLKIQSIIGS